MQPQKSQQPPAMNSENQEKMLSVSGKKKCSHCGDELGRPEESAIENITFHFIKSIFLKNHLKSTDTEIFLLSRAFLQFEQFYRIKRLLNKFELI